jgi:carboxymethylenebutenolidase
MVPRPRTFSPDQLLEEEVRIVEGEGLRAFLCRPDATGPFAAVLVAHEVYGLDSAARDACRRLAQAGYVALCPDLWSRGDTPAVAPTGAGMEEALAGLPDERALSDLAASLRWLEERREVERGHVGIAGCCMGGTVALLFACRSWDVRACAVFYARLRRERTPFHPASPIESVSALRCPLLGVFGADDPAVPADDVEALRRRLERHAKEFELLTYEGAGHGFLNPEREGFRPGPAEDAWKRLLEFLESKVRR